MLRHLWRANHKIMLRTEAYRSEAGAHDAPNVMKQKRAAFAALLRDCPTQPTE